MLKYEDVLMSAAGGVGLVTLNRPHKLNAWDGAMREHLMEVLNAFNADGDIGAIVLTGAGNRAFCAGQDLEEARAFKETDAEGWIRSWEQFYQVLRGLSKPLVIALNGTAAGSAFQVALLGDIRVGHPGVRMGQPEINAGVASVTGPWLMKMMLGMSRTRELVLTGRLMDAQECRDIGLIHHLVAADEVMPQALRIARELADKPPVAVRLNKQRFREITDASFADTIEAAIRLHEESYASGEPQRMMAEFFATRQEARGQS